MTKPTFFSIEDFKTLYNKDLTISGTIIHGQKIGRKINFPTANIEVDNFNLLPNHGVYAVIVKIQEKQYYGMINVGNKPTFNSNKMSFEVHILNFNEDIYNEKIEVHFVKFLRNQLKFESIEELKNQLDKDKNETMKVFKITK